MFGFVKRIFVLAMMLFSCNLPSINPLKYVSMNNQECKIRPMEWWNEDKYRCKCEELIDKGICNKGFIGHPSN